MYLEQLVAISAIEDMNMECKAKLSRNDVVGWLKTIAGFSNAEGGLMNTCFQGPHCGYLSSDMKKMDGNYI